MTASLRLAIALIGGLVFLSAGCDRAEKREAEAEALRKKPPVQTGNIREAMGAERLAPKIPSADERLLIAIRGGDRARAHRWLDQGASIDAKAPVLVAAVRGKGDLAFIEWLVGAGAAVDVPDPAGRTPLSWAAGEGSVEEVTYLLAQGANVGTRDQLGRTPLHFAVFSEETEVVELLLNASADINAQDSLGTTPLMYACAKNQAAVIEALKARGADPGVKDKLGRTAAERAHGDENPCTP